MNSTFPHAAPIFYSPSYNGLVGVGNDAPYPFVPSTYLSPFSPLNGYSLKFLVFGFSLLGILHVPKL